MREKLIIYVRNMFRNVPDNRQNRDLEAEILQNSLDRFDDLTAQGVDEETAYTQAVSSIGDVRHLMAQETQKPRKHRVGWIVAIICVLLLLAAVGVGVLLVSRYIVANRTRGEVGLEDRMEDWAEGMEQDVEQWVQGTVMDLLPGSQYAYPETGNYKSGEAVVAVSEVSVVELDWIAGQITVQLWDEDTVSVSESGSGKHPMKWQLENGRLTVRYCETGIAANLEQKDLLVQLPRDADHLQLSISTVSASADLACGALQSLRFDSTSGDLTGEAQCGSFAADTTSGNVNFSGAAGEAELDTVSGMFSMNLTDTLRELSFDSVSGDLELTLPETLGFEVEWDTVSGEFRHEHSLQRSDDDGWSFYGSSGFAEIEIDTTSGDAQLRMK